MHWPFVTSGVPFRFPPLLPARKRGSRSPFAGAERPWPDSNAFLLTLRVISRNLNVMIEKTASSNRRIASSDTGEDFQMPNMTRRACLAMTAAAVFMPKAGFTAQRLAMGDAELITLSDGNLTLPAEFIFGPAPQEPLSALAAEMGIDPTAPLTPPCNVTLLRNGDRNILFDAGAGPSFQASAGRLADALGAEGLSPDDITDVIFTHAHPDHLWGVLDDFDEPLFLNAAYKMGRTERDYWMDPDTVQTIGEARASFAAGASRRLETLEGMLDTFDDGEEVVPGVVAVSTAGHTPGHMSFAVSSGDKTVMVIGDAVGNDHIAMARPDWPSGADQDLETGAATRSRLLDQLATDGLMAVGFHMGGGGLGRVERSGDGYRFVTEI